MDEDKENRKPDTSTATIDNLSFDLDHALHPLQGSLANLVIDQSLVSSPRHRSASPVANDPLPAFDFGAIDITDSFGGPLSPNQQSDNSPTWVLQDDFEFPLQAQTTDINEQNVFDSNLESLHENNEQHCSDNVASGNPPCRTNLHREPLEELGIDMFGTGHDSPVTQRTQLAYGLLAPPGECLQNRY